jgi:hypothetical protein
MDFQNNFTSFVILAAMAGATYFIVYGVQNFNDFTASEQIFLVIAMALAAIFDLYFLAKLSYRGYKFTRPKNPQIFTSSSI